MRIGILGPLEVQDESGRAVEVRGARLRALLVRLAIDAGRSVSAERLIEDLWEGAPPVSAGNALQALVSRLRGLNGRDAIRSGAGGYQLTVVQEHIDAVVFEQRVTAARAVLAGGDAGRAAELLREALAMWRGPALADVADQDFATATIARLEELRLAATEDRIDADLAAGSAERLVPELEGLVTAHPLRERLRGQLMRALCAAGRRGDALLSYEEARRVLGDRLGVDPSLNLSALHLSILRDELPPPAPREAPAPPGIPAALEVREDPAVPTSPAGSGILAGTAASGDPAAPGDMTAPGGLSAPVPRLSNLPAQLTSFVGREAEVDRVGRRLAEARLVTLTGPGGAGKTRLACEAAARLAAGPPAEGHRLGALQAQPALPGRRPGPVELPDGVWLVPLAPVRDPVDVPQAVLAAIGLAEASPLRTPVSDVRELAPAPPLDRLAEALADRRLLLVLDNCEHLIDAIAALADRLLTAAPGVRVLATSREPLGITGETLCPVPSLALPPENCSPAEAPAYASVRLFADRAAAVRPGFTMDAETTGPVVQICRALDGIPLAIELAAARLRSLTPAQVASRLDDRFRLLAAGSRAAQPRHQTLWAIVDWSWDLLDDTERAVLRRLSVFSGGATPDSAEQVCALDPDDNPAGIIDVIAALVDKSLVVATGNAEVRYRLLETVRAYAAERLREAGEAERVRSAHAGYFVALAERADPGLRGPGQLRWRARLVAEHDNCSAALRHAIDSRDAPTALRFIGSLEWFWIMQDYEAEAAEWTQEVRRIAGDTAPPGLAEPYAICVLTAGLADQAKSGEPLDGAAIQRNLERARSLIPPVPEHPVLLFIDPVAAVFAGAHEDALRMLDALTGNRDPWVRAVAFAVSGHLRVNMGQIDQAADALTAGYREAQAIGDHWTRMLALSAQAEVAMARDAPAESIRLLEEAYEICELDGKADRGCLLLIKRGWALARTGEIEAAKASLKRGVEAADRTGAKPEAAEGHLWLAEIARAAGDLAEAGELLDQALRLAESVGRRPDAGQVTGIVLSKLGCLAEQRGDLAGAAEWHQRATRHIHEQGHLLPTNPTLGTVVEGYAAIAAARGDHERAAEMLGGAHTMHGFVDSTSLEVRRVTAAAIDALGRKAFDAAYTRGRGLTREEAFALTP